MKRVSEDVFRENLVSVFKPKQSKTNQEDPFVQVIKTARAEAEKKLEEAVNTLCPPPPISEEDIREAGPQIVAEIESIYKDVPDGPHIMFFDYNEDSGGLYYLDYYPTDTYFKCDWWSKVINWSKKVVKDIDTNETYDDVDIFDRAEKLHAKYLQLCTDVIETAWYCAHPSFKMSISKGIMRIEMN